MEKTKTFDKLNSTFNMDSSTLDVELVKSLDEKNLNSSIVNSSIEIDSNDIEKDYNYTRENLYWIIEKGKRAIDGCLEYVQDRESPRAYEALAQLIKNFAESTEKIMELQKRLKDIKSDDERGNSLSITNAAFVGSTLDLSKFLKSQKNAKT